MSEVVRVTCVHENCGTFPMDQALVAKLKRTGDPFTCPAGHEQHFTGTPPKQRLQERIQELETTVERLEAEVEDWRQEANDAWDDVLDLQRQRRTLESALYERADGVIQLMEDEDYRWACACGSHCRTSFATEKDARDALDLHRQDSCDHTGSAGADA